MKWALGILWNPEMVTLKSFLATKQGFALACCTSSG